MTCRVRPAEAQQQPPRGCSEAPWTLCSGREVTRPIAWKQTSGNLGRLCLYGESFGAPTLSARVTAWSGPHTASRLRLHSPQPPVALLPLPRHPHWACTPPTASCAPGPPLCPASPCRALTLRWPVICVLLQVGPGSQGPEHARERGQGIAPGLPHAGVSGPSSGALETPPELEEEEHCVAVRAPDGGGARHGAGMQSPGV